MAEFSSEIFADINFRRSEKSSYGVVQDEVIIKHSTELERGSGFQEAESIYRTTQTQPSTGEVLYSKTTPSGKRVRNFSLIASTLFCLLLVLSLPWGLKFPIPVRIFIFRLGVSTSDVKTMVFSLSIFNAVTMYYGSAVASNMILTLAASIILVCFSSGTEIVKTPFL